MGEAKIKEEVAAVPFDQWVKDLIQKAVDEKQGNDDVSLTAETIMKRIYSETIHRSNLVLCAHVATDEKGNGRLVYTVGQHHRHIIEQASCRLNYELYNVFTFMTMMDEKKRQEANKSGLIIPAQ